jgi:aspartyl-tRNA(Asn)/glutamyl-tRNA(Gln) amidotransferase subunit C
MKIDRETIEHLEALARIELGEEERERLAEQMGRIVAFVEKLQSVDTSGVVGDERVENGVTGAERLRDDKSDPGLDRDDVLSQAPDAAEGCFRVPRVIDRD